jgi:hypothetical protein
VKGESDWWDGQIGYRGTLNRNSLVLHGQMARRNVRKNSNFRKAYGWIRKEKKWMVTRPEKRTELSGYTQADHDKVALRLNQRPRKTLGFETPASRLQASVAMTHRDRPGFRKLVFVTPSKQL